MLLPVILHSLPSKDTILPHFLQAQMGLYPLLYSLSYIYVHFQAPLISL